MTALQTFQKAGIFILIMLFGFSSFLYAQADSNAEEVQQYEELVKYQTNHTIEQEEDTQSFSEIMTGIGTKTPDDVFLAESSLSPDTSILKKAELPQNMQEVPVGDFEFIEYDDLFANESGGDFGLSVGASTGRCPPGSGGDTRWVQNF